MFKIIHDIYINGIFIPTKASNFRTLYFQYLVRYLATLAIKLSTDNISQITFLYLVLDNIISKNVGTKSFE